MEFYFNIVYVWLLHDGRAAGGPDQVRIPLLWTGGQRGGHCGQHLWLVTPLIYLLSASQTSGPDCNEKPWDSCTMATLKCPTYGPAFRVESRRRKVWEDCSSRPRGLLIFNRPLFPSHDLAVFNYGPPENMSPFRSFSFFFFRGLLADLPPANLVFKRPASITRLDGFLPWRFVHY